MMTLNIRSVSSAGGSVTSSVMTTCVSSTATVETSSNVVPVSSAATTIVDCNAAGYVSSSHDAVVEQARQVSTISVYYATFNFLTTRLIAFVCECGHV